MEREILFRGKRVDNGEWVYGYLGKWPIRGWKELSHFIIPVDGLDDGIAEQAEVFAETIGQYTGLIDKNGVKIYEGDILRFGKRNLMVWWNAESFQWQAKEVYGYDVITKEHWLDNDWTNIDFGWIASEIACVGKMTTEIIGNIFDNHELMDSGR